MLNVLVFALQAVAFAVKGPKNHKEEQQQTMLSAPLIKTKIVLIIDWCSNHYLALYLLIITITILAFLNHLATKSKLTQAKIVLKESRPLAVKRNHLQPIII